MSDLSTILIVEDDPDDAELIRYAFDKAGVSNPLTFAKDGRIALDYINGDSDYAGRFRHPLPALVLLDLKLPFHSGFEVLRFIRQRSATRNIPVVVLTSSNQSNDIRRAYDLGANSYLVKPVSRAALLDMVRLLDSYWIKLNYSVNG